MKRNSFIIGAILLTVGAFIARAIGAIYKIPLANILGSNGIGVYYLIFPLYSLLLVLTSSGVSVAVSKMISYERTHNNRKNEITLFKVAFVYVFITSIIFSALMIVFNQQISILQGNANASLGYIAIAPAIIFASLISVVRAYFQGLQNMIPTSISNVVEQLVKLSFGLVLAHQLIPFGVEYAVLGAILAVSFSELVALILMVINYIFYRKKFYRERNSKPISSPMLTTKKALWSIIKYSLPATLSSLIIPVTAVMDSVMVINLLTSSGISTVSSTSLYGISNGMVNTVISLPVIFTVALSTAIVPNLSGLYAKNNHEEVSFKSSFFIKITWLVALPSFVVVGIFAPEIIEILYKRGLTEKVFPEYDFAYKLLTVASVSIVYYAFLQTFTSILQSINKPLLPFISLFLGLVIRTLVLVLLIKNHNINIFSVIIANTIFLLISTTINLLFVRKYVKLKFEFSKLVLSPLTAGLVMMVVAMVFKNLLSVYLSTLIYTVICGVLCFGSYVVILYALRVFNRRERSMFPKLKKIKIK